MRPVVFCLDMQRIYVQQNPARQSYWDALKDNIAHIRAAARANDIPFVHVGYGDPNNTFGDDDDRFMPYDGGVGPYREMPLPTRLVIDRFGYMGFDVPVYADDLAAFKTTCSLMGETTIADWLDKNSFTNVYLCGISELNKGGDVSCDGHCLSESARDLTFYDYRVTIVEEGTNCGIKTGSEFLPLEQRIVNQGPRGAAIQPMRAILAAWAQRRAARPRDKARTSLSGTEISYG